MSRPGIAVDRPVLRDWLASQRADLDAVVLDIDGVLARHHRALPGAVELLAAMDAMGLPYRLLTNDACRSPEEKAEYLRAAGLDVDSEMILSAGDAVRGVVERQGLAGQVFYAMGRLGVPDYGRRAGLAVTRDLSALEGPDCRGVIVGEKEYDWEPAVNAVVNYLIRVADAMLICPNPDLYHPVRDERIHLSSGAVTHLVRDMVRSYGKPCEPIYLGKPHEPVFALNHARLEHRAGAAIARGRVLMVGDSLGADMAGARAFGYRTALTLTGLTTPDMLTGLTTQPDVVLSGL